MDQHKGHSNKPVWLIKLTIVSADGAVAGTNIYL
jgi:hypothetical protein